jgi:hypothetical protein
MAEKSCPEIVFGMTAEDASRLEELLRSKDISTRPSALTEVNVPLGFDLEQIKFIAVAMMPFVEVGVTTFHIHMLAHLILDFLRTWNREIFVKYENGNVEIKTSGVEAEEVERLLERLLSDRKTTVLIMPPRR